MTFRHFQTRFRMRIRQPNQSRADREKERGKETHTDIKHGPMHVEQSKLVHSTAKWQIANGKQWLSTCSEWATGISFGLPSKIVETYHNSPTYPWVQLVWGDNFSPVPAETTAPCRRPAPGADCPWVCPRPWHCREENGRGIRRVCRDSKCIGQVGR